jgi:UPF0716 protein FxsA
MPALLLVAFLAVPIAELYVIVQVASVIGGWQTLAVLIAESLLGTWLVKREGRRTWRAFQAALDRHRPPAREVADGALVIVGGTLLLTPGFLSDIVGFFFLLPLTRPLARRLLLRIASRRVARRVGISFPTRFPDGSAGRRPDAGHGAVPPTDRPRHGDPQNPVIEGEIVDDPLRKPGRNDGTPPKP